MAINDLLRSGRIRRETISPAEVREALKLADRDLRVARKLMGEELDWGFTVAYNAVLQAGRAFMFAKGYRPASAFCGTFAGRCCLRELPARALDATTSSTGWRRGVSSGGGDLDVPDPADQDRIPFDVKRADRKSVV
jgi:hypothetical protein